MKIREYIQVKPAGETPDPAVFCPINGYILNPVNPDDGWFLIAEFPNDSPNSTTFDPRTLRANGTLAWDLGDGTIILYQDSVSYTYSDSSPRVAALYGKGTCNLSTVEVQSDNLIGIIDLSHSAFSSAYGWYIVTNSGITGLILPSVITVNIYQFYVISTGFIGVLDLSVLQTFTDDADIAIYSNSAMTGVMFAASVTGKIRNLSIYSMGHVGILDLSMFDYMSAASMQIFSNPAMTGLLFKSVVTGTMTGISIYSNSTLVGVLYLDMFSSFSAAASITIYSNPLMTGVVFASSIAGTFTSIQVRSLNITGTLDLSMFNSFGATTTISLYSNPTMTGVVFASSIAGTIATMRIDSTGITGVLDISKFTAWTATGTLYLNNNLSMTGVTFPSSTITGFIRTLRIYSNTSLGYIDFTKLRTGVNSLKWDMQNNAWTAAIVNQILVEIDGISVGGFTSRVINIGGTNADPDTTSGGYNGSAARTSLIAKAFTVTIT